VGAERLRLSAVERHLVTLDAVDRREDPALSFHARLGGLDPLDDRRGLHGRIGLADGEPDRRAEVRAAAPGFDARGDTDRRGQRPEGEVLRVDLRAVGVPVGAVERVSGILDGRSYAGSGRFGVSGDRFGTLTDRVGDRSRDGDGRRRHRAGDRREQKQHREGYREGLSYHLDLRRDIKSHQ